MTVTLPRRAARARDVRARDVVVPIVIASLCVARALGAQGPWRGIAETEASGGRGAAALGTAQWLVTAGGTLRVTGPIDAGVYGLAAEARDRTRAGYGAGWLAVPLARGVGVSGTAAMLVGTAAPTAMRWDVGLHQRWRPTSGAQLAVRVAAGRLARTLDRDDRETGGSDASLDVTVRTPITHGVQAGVELRTIAARRDAVTLDALGFGVDAPVPVGVSRRVTVVDLAPTLRWTPWRRIALDVAVTTRVAGARGGVRAAPQGALEVAVDDGVTFVLAAGEQLADPRLLLARVRWASLGVRLAWRTTPSPTRPPRPRASDMAQEGAIAIVDDSIVVTVPVTARAVALRGDFTDWAVRRCTRTAPARVTCGAAPAAGAHRVAVRMDDGPWRAPTNLPVLRDDFGAEDGDWLVSPAATTTTRATRP